MTEGERWTKGERQVSTENTMAYLLPNVFTNVGKEQTMSLKCEKFANKNKNITRHIPINRHKTY